MKSRSVKLMGTCVAAATLATLGTSVASAKTETGTIKGQAVDLMCYLDHGASGEKHADCAKTCIESGGPVGVLTKDKQLYVVIGDHKPLNHELAPLAAKTVTLKGKIVERDGVKMLENAEIEK